MDPFDILWRLDADAAGLVAGMAKGEAATRGLADSNDLLRRHGIRTTDQIQKELVELNHLQRELKEDELATLQLARAKERLYLELRQTTRGLRLQDQAVAASGRSFGALGGGIRSAAGYMAAAFSVQAVGHVAARLYEMATAAGEVQSKFETVFLEASADVDAFGQTWANVAGLTQTQFRSLAADVGAIVRGFGFAGQAAGDFSLDVVKLAGDLQSFHNVPIEETFQALRSGLTGEAEPLKRFGIILYDAEVKTRAAAVAARLHTSATDQQTLALARLELITEKAGVAVGDLERTQDSAANVGRRLGATVREMADAFAGSLVPGIIGVQGSLGGFLDTHGDALKTWASDVGTKIAELIVALKDLGQTVATLGPQADAAESDFLGLKGVLEELKREAELAADVFAVLGIGINTLGGLIRRIGGPIARVLGLEEWADEMDRTVQSLDAETTALLVQIGVLDDYSNRLGKAVGQTDALKGAALGLQAVLATMPPVMIGPDGQPVFAPVNVGGTPIPRPPPPPPPTPRPTGGGGSGGRRPAADPTFLQEQQAAARELAKELAYLETSDGRRALAIERQNFFLKEQIRLTTDRVRIEGRPADERVTAFVVDQARRRAADRGPIPGAAADAVTVEPKPSPYPELAESAKTAADKAKAAWYGVRGALESEFGSMAQAGQFAFGFLADAAGAAFEASGQKAKAFFAIQKGFLIGQAIMETYKSATSAYSALAPIPFVGPFLGAAAAAAAVVAGLANVARIKATQPGGSASGGSGYEGASGSSGTNSAGYQVVQAGNAQGGGANAYPVSIAPASASGPSPGTVANRHAKAAAQMEAAAGRMEAAVEQLTREGVQVVGTVQADGEDLSGSFARTEANKSLVGASRVGRRVVSVTG